jgi:hypothetical protein
MQYPIGTLVLVLPNHPAFTEGERCGEIVGHGRHTLREVGREYPYHQVRLVKSPGSGEIYDGKVWRLLKGEFLALHPDTPRETVYDAVSTEAIYRR